MDDKTFHESFEELKAALLVFLLELGKLLRIDKLVDLLNDGKRGMNVSELLKRLEMERMQGNFALSNYPNDEYWVNWDELVNVFEEYEQPQLNENQQIVLDWLKKQYFRGYGPAIIRTIHLLQRENSVDISGSKTITQAYRSLNTAGEAVVVKMFAAWALEQEEE